MACRVACMLWLRAGCGGPLSGRMAAHISLICNTKDHTVRLDRYLGVYSTVESAPFSAGRPGKPSSRKRYWSVWAKDGDEVLVQPLTGSLDPGGDIRPVPRAELESRFMHEPGLTALLPAESDAADGGQLKIELEGDDPFYASDAAAGEDYRQEDERPARLDLDELTLEEAEETEHAARTDFAFALTYLRRGETDRARALFESLAAPDARYQPGHRHMFTDFGISLRKSGLPEVALMHHKRALQLSPSDDHIHFNIARVCFDMGNMRDALHHLEASLAMNPQLEASKRFKEYILNHEKHGR